MITVHAEGTFASLRYSFGGDHPSQTTHHTMSPSFHGLEPNFTKGGISTSTPPALADQLHSLPPILHIIKSSPM